MQRRFDQFDGLPQIIVQQGRETRGEHTEEDVFHEAFLIAKSIERKRGFPVDFSNRGDQEIVLGWLYRELVTFADKRVRFAVKLDKDWDSDDSECAGSVLEKLLAAPEQLDPLFLVQAAHEHDSSALLGLIKHSYSQCTAYAILLDRFDWELESLAEALRLVVATVRNRIVASSSHMKRQSSLFDRIQAIERDFAPTVARGGFHSQFEAAGLQQLELNFG